MNDQEQAVARAKLRARIIKAAFHPGVTCPTCHGDGTVPGGRRMVHTYRGGLGADNSLADVLDEFDNAQSVRLVEAVLGPVAVIEHPGKDVVVDL